LSGAIACERVFRSNPEWRSEFRRTGRLPESARVEPGCRALIEGWHDYIWRNEPYDVGERRDFFMSIQSEMNIRYHEALSSRDASRLFLGWYNTVPEADRARAREYFEWLLIEQAISREWLALGEPDPAAARRREMRRQHLDFLAARIGRPLRGISREGL
jgi:hypothetical protein